MKRFGDNLRIVRADLKKARENLKKRRAENNPNMIEAETFEKGQSPIFSAEPERILENKYIIHLVIQTIFKPSNQSI